MTLHPVLFHQIVSLLGACFVLIAYIGHQAKWMHSDSVAYNLLNVLGAGLLAYVALKPLQIGFLVTEGVWFTISLVTFCKALSAKRKLDGE